MTDLQQPSPAVEQTVDRGVPLLPPELATPLVSPPFPPSLPATAAQTRALRTVDDTHLLQSHANAELNRKRRKKRLSLKQPKDSKVRRTVFAALAMKAQGKKNDEIAEACGITKNTLKTYMYRAHHRGWLTVESLEDPDDALEVVLKTKTVRNLDEFLEKRDKDVTIESAKGLGLFKTHQIVKNDQPAALAFALSVNVEMPPPGAAPLVARIGSVGGQPYFDAEVIEGEDA